MEQALETFTSSIVYVMLIAFFVVLWKTHSTWRLTVWRFSGLCILYGLTQIFRIIDESGYGWRAFGQDFSSHGAAAFGLSVMIGGLMPRSIGALAFVNIGYWALMMFLGYHTIAHIVFSLAVYAPLSVGIFICMAKAIKGFVPARTPTRSL